MPDFREYILPGEILSDGSFSFDNFVDIKIVIPKEFINAALGYGRYYAMDYGRTL